jgi:hypothetical protein
MQVMVPAPVMAPANGSAPAPAPAAVAPATPKGITVRGIAEFPDGKRPGYITFVLGREGGRPIVGGGRDGKFEVRVPEAGRYRFGGALVDFEKHEYLPEEIDIEQGKEFRLALEYERTVTLLVLDEATRKPLPGAAGLRAKGIGHRYFPGVYPTFDKGDADPVLDDGEGRITLGPGRGVAKVWVVADGHAFVRVEVPFAGTGESVVLLPPGGRVRVRVPGWESRKDPRCILDSGGAQAWLPKPGRKGEFVLDGLPCGKSTFRVREGDISTSSDVSTSSREIGKATVDVRPGCDETVTIELVTPETSPTVAVWGEVEYDPAWELKSTSVRFTGLDEGNRDVSEEVKTPKRRPGNPLPFRTTRLIPGRYQVEVEPQWRTEIVVQPGGGEFRFEVPPPVEIRVRVVERETGKPIRGAEVHWHGASEGLRSYRTEFVRPDPDPGVFTIRAPSDIVDISARAPGWLENTRKAWRAEDPETEALPESGELTMALEKAGMVRVVLRQGEGAFSPAGLDVWIRLKESKTKAGGSSVHSFSLPGEGGRFTADSVPPGSHFVQVKDKDGRFEPVADRPVEVRAGETTEVVVDLVRKK